MIAFDLKRHTIKHVLLARKGDRVAARVAGRTVPTVETEQGRMALLPNGAMPWAKKMGLAIYSPMRA